MIVNLLKDESAATMVEYAIMVVLIAAVCITIVSFVGLRTSNQYSTANSAINSAL